MLLKDIRDGQFLRLTVNLGEGYCSIGEPLTVGAIGVVCRLDRTMFSLTILDDNTASDLARGKSRRWLFPSEASRWFEPIPVRDERSSDAKTLTGVVNLKER